MPQIEWEQIYGEAREITDVPWETVKPSAELESLLMEGKLMPCNALDVGCGFGTHAIFLSKKGFDVTAFDISEKAIAVAQKRAEKEKVRVDFFVGDALKTRQSGKFGFVFDRGLFHSLDPVDRERYIKKIHSLLERKGKYYLEMFTKKNPPGPGPHRFSRKEIEETFSPFFTILQMKEIIHRIDKKGLFGLDKAYLYSVLMEKK